MLKVVDLPNSLTPRSLAAEKTTGSPLPKLETTAEAAVAALRVLRTTGEEKTLFFMPPASVVLLREQGSEALKRIGVLSAKLPKTESEWKSQKDSFTALSVSFAEILKKELNEARERQGRWPSKPVEKPDSKLLQATPFPVHVFVNLYCEFAGGVMLRHANLTESNINLFLTRALDKKHINPKDGRLTTEGVANFREILKNPGYLSAAVRKAMFPNGKPTDALVEMYAKALARDLPIFLSLCPKFRAYAKGSVACADGATLLRIGMPSAPSQLTEVVKNYQGAPNEEARADVISGLTKALQVMHGKSFARVKSTLADFLHSPAKRVRATEYGELLHGSIRQNILAALIKRRVFSEPFIDAAIDYLNRSMPVDLGRSGIFGNTGEAYVRYLAEASREVPKGKLRDKINAGILSQLRGRAGRSIVTAALYEVADLKLTGAANGILTLINEADAQNHFHTHVRCNVSLRSNEKHLGAVDAALNLARAGALSSREVGSIVDALEQFHDQKNCRTEVPDGTWCEQRVLVRELINKLRKVINLKPLSWAPDVKLSPIRAATATSVQSIQSAQ